MYTDSCDEKNTKKKKTGNGGLGRQKPLKSPGYNRSKSTHSTFLLNIITYDMRAGVKTTMSVHES